MTQNPWEFAFYTRRKAVILPFNPNPKVVVELAKKFKADYFVIIENDARHEGFDSLEENGTFPDYLVPVHFSPGLVIGKFRSIR